MGVVRWLLILSVFFVLILFGVENMEMVPLKFSLMGVFSYEVFLPLFFVVVVSVFAGSVLAGFIGMADHIRMHTRIRKQKKNIDRLENEVKSLRNMPLEEEAGDDLPGPSSLKE
jgi:putative membrane protein